MDLLADDMAKNVCGLFLSDYGMGVTGYASLVAEQEINSLFAYVSIARKDKVKLAKKNRCRQTRQQSCTYLLY
jgi:nicotinamide-nucleotide amidase